MILVLIEFHQDLRRGVWVIYTFSFLPIFNHSKSSLLVSAKSSNSQAWYDWKLGFPVLNFPILVHQSIDSLDHCSLLWWLHPHEIDSKSPISWTHRSFSSCITIRFWLYHVIFTILVDYWWWIPNSHAPFWTVRSWFFMLNLGKIFNHRGLNDVKTTIAAQSPSSFFQFWWL